MTQTSVSESIVSALLGWIKGLANWVLRLFHLAGNGASPLLWLSNNWLKLLIVLMVIGVGMDVLVWLIRWRPYWVWFRRKRVVVNDERLLRPVEGESDNGLEQRYTVQSKVVRPPERKMPEPEKQKRDVRVPKHRPRSVESHAARPIGERPVRRPAPRPAVRPVRDTVFEGDLFDVRRDRAGYSDFYEDEVFNVSNLPKAKKNTQRPRR